jgi:DNA polymerase-3 subunit epsilon
VLGLLILVAAQLTKLLDVVVPRAANILIEFTQLLGVNCGWCHLATSLQRMSTMLAAPAVGGAAIVSCKTPPKPSGAARIKLEVDLLSQPLISTEFVALDTETNGLSGEACELTEVGAVLVGGGELHDAFESLVHTNMPLGRGIQRFTGITQAMVDAAPEPDAVLPSLELMLRGRVLVAHNASFDRRVLRQAFTRIGLDWPRPPVICTAALARSLLPLQRERRLAALADALGIEVALAHRALADAQTCGRIFCALFPRLCANAATVADGLALVAPKRRRASAPRRRRGREWAMTHRPTIELEFDSLPTDPGVYIFRDERGVPLYVGKSISIRSRARAHFAPSTQRAAWTTHARIVDYRATCSELGALITENRLIKQLRPPGNVRLNLADDRLCYIRCRLDIAYPVLEVARAPAAGRAVNIGPLRGRRWAQELVEQLESLFTLRHCGRSLARREHPSAYGQMGRCMSPCLGDLDPNAYRRLLDSALRLFLGGDDARALLLAHVDAQMRNAAAAQRYERAAALRRRLARLRTILERVEGVLAATHSRPRLVLAPHPTAQRFDALWLAGGRLVDFGELPQDAAELLTRTEVALRRAGRAGELGAHVPPDEIDELRILDTYIAPHPQLPELPLLPAPSERDLCAFVAAARAARGAQANGSSTTSASPAESSDTRAPSGASRRTSASAIGPSRGDSAVLVTRPAARS